MRIYYNLKLNKMVRTERQAHGFIFQGWVLKTFLNLTYTAKWDIPPAINPITGKGVSIKTAKWKNSIGMGDALTQFEINEDFELLVAFYEDGKRKKIVNLNLVEIKVEQWKQMWGNLSEENLIHLNNLIKDKSKRNLKGLELDTFRKSIQKDKKTLLREYNGCISLNPKIDSKNQRRLQCSIPFKTFFKKFKLKKRKMVKYVLWGKEICLSTVRLD